MDRFVRRLFTDAGFQGEFLANPGGTIANSGLAGHERDAAERLAGRLGVALRSPSAMREEDPLFWN